MDLASRARVCWRPFDRYWAAKVRAVSQTIGGLL